MSNPDVVDLKRNFVTLDGFRGVAALGVVSLHYATAFGPLTLHSAYLAVDLFFIISGIVIAYTYDGRFSSGMTVRQFMKIRVWRLYPLYLLGFMIAAVPLLVTIPFGISNHHWTWADYSRSLAFGLFMLPDPAHPMQTLYPLNAPSWSLLWELLVNLLYAAAFPWITRRVLVAAILLSGAALIGTCLHLGSADYGYEWHAVHVPFLRVIFSFSVGVLFARLYREGRLPQLPVPTWALLIVIVAIIGMPVQRLGWPDALAIIIMFPAICLAAMRSEPRFVRFHAFVGRISYPLYVTHMPLLPVIYGALHVVMRRPIGELAPWTGFAALACLIVAAAVFARAVDPWLRRVLTLGLSGLAWRPRSALT